MKKGALLLVFITLILSSSFAAAVADVAYIYKKAYKVDNNVVQRLNSLGLTVDLIQENSITSSNLNPYKIIFVNDELFLSPNKIPVNTKPSIVVNYYHADFWGLTDAEGVSQLAANHPLSVVVNGQMKQVYTQAKEGIGGASIPYYYLDQDNKAPDLESVALTETTSSGSDVGDVISLGSPGDHLFNGKTQQAKLCFYGIAKSKYWTQNARDLFDQCVSHVISECDFDNECPAPEFTSTPYCLDGDVYKDQASYMCEAVGPGNACVQNEAPFLIEECQFGCENGQCLDVQCFQNSDCGTSGFTGDNFCSNNDVAKNFTSFVCNNPGTPQSYCSTTTAPQITEQCQDTCENGACTDFSCDDNTDCVDSNPLTFDECVNPGTIISECRHTPINCASNIDCGSSGFTGTEFCSVNNVVKNFNNATCINAGTLQSSCSNSVNQVVLQQCANACFNGACIPCDTNSDCNDNNANTQDICNNPSTPQAFCSNTPLNIVCDTNSDCGIDGLVGASFCSQGDVVQSYKTYTCNFPNTPQAFCSSSLQNTTTQQCSSGCASGQCTDIECTTNSQCDDNNVLTLDQCVNPGTVNSNCENTPINCNSNIDCGVTGFVGTEFCSLDDVYKNFQNATCVNPATLSSYCNVQVTQTLVNNCPQTCANGACVACNSNSQCNDGNSATIDLCNSPGTPQSYCSHQSPNQTIACFNNVDCGMPSILSPQFCSNKNITQLTSFWTCLNPGTTTSYCASGIMQQTVQSCSNFCSNGACVDIECFNNLDCNDNNSTTLDVCLNPGTQQSSCTNTPIPAQNITCSTNAQCGSTSIVSVNFCSAQNISNLVQSWTCNNPGTPLSFCSSAITKQNVQMCPQFCSNGACVDIECFNHADCNDNNVTTLDICTNPGTPQSYCSNNPIDITCGSDSDCGTDGFVNGDICVGNEVTKLFQEFTCNFPNTPLSYCSSTLSQITTETCSFACSNGMCVNVPPICGNGILEAGEQCDDSNTQNGDGCSSICVVETECTPGDTQQCGQSSVGLCEYGTQTCNSQGEWGSCIGAVNPATEICDTFDNDCDGSSDEGNVCPQNPVCGNQLIEQGEQCDDGNTNNGDGCSSSCQIEIPSCTNECTQGATQCVNSGASRICANFDADPCTEWSLPASCGSGSTCVNGSCN